MPRTIRAVPAQIVLGIVEPVIKRLLVGHIEASCADIRMELRKLIQRFRI